jgi:hypothetical protein
LLASTPNALKIFPIDFYRCFTGTSALKVTAGYQFKDEEND